MRKQFEELHPLFDLEKDEQGEYTCVLTRVTWLGFELGKRTLQAEIDQLKAQLNNMEACYIEKKKELEDQQKRIDEVLEYLDGESANRWGLWKEKADMLDQGASNAFEEAYWMAKKVLRGEHG